MSNIDIAKAYINAVQTGDQAALGNIFHPNVVWHQPGNNKFSGTKNGMAVGEAVIFFDTALALDFDYRCKQAGQLASKMRFLSAPWVGLLETGAWLRNARHANACAHLLAERIADLPDAALIFPVEANAVFLQLPADAMEALRARGWRFYTFIGGGARFMFAWDAQPARVDALIADLRAVAA